MRVVIVDDSKGMRMIIGKTLKQAGFLGLDIREAVDGLEAWDVIARHRPQLVLSDWNMPEMNGIELLLRLRQNGNKVRFGFVTCESGAEAARRAYSAGADFLITKPFTVQKFEVMLSPILVG